MTDTASTTCVCGHSIEEHGHDDDHPGSTACGECEPDECIAYEAAPPEEQEEEP